MKKVYLINPMSAPRMNKSDAWKKRPVVLKYRAYKDKLKELNAECPVGCHIIFNIPMSKSWSDKKKHLLDGEPHIQRPDIDNLLKGYFDSLFEEDCYIWKISAEKRWAFIGSIVIIMGSNDK